jgi:hypothetical protein
LSVGQKIFFHVKLCLEPMDVEQKLLFQLLLGIDASWWEPRVPVCSSVFERDDEGFGEGSFIPSSLGYGIFIGHEKFASISVSVVFRQRGGSVRRRPWCEL